MRKETIGGYLRTFCKDVTNIYGPRFLNSRPTRIKSYVMTKTLAAAGFPDCVGAVDCMKMH